MSDEIVRRLMHSKKSTPLFESSPSSKSKNYKDLLEAPEDEELEDEDPVEDEELDTEDTPDESELGDEEIDNPLLRKYGSSPDTPEEDSESEEVDAEEEPAPAPKPDAENSNNPLDNPYAVSYTIGSSVVLSYNDGTNSEMEGTIEGYDKEGFYRVKWNNGLLTNGITDVAIAALIDHQEESKCICGSNKLIREGRSIVCDKCGRILRENSDPLTKSDKSRPKGKKLIRSEASPMSTSIPECSTKKSLKDSIRSAFSKSPKIHEDWDDGYEDDEDEKDLFAGLVSSLSGEFWTRLPELVRDIEDLGYDVYEANEEYVVVAVEDAGGDEHTMQIPVAGTSRTMTLDFNKSRRY